MFTTQDIFNADVGLKLIYNYAPFAVRKYSIDLLKQIGMDAIDSK